MAKVIILDKNKNIVNYLDSANAPDYKGKPDFIVFSDDDKSSPMSEKQIAEMVSVTPFKYLKFENGSIRQMTPAEQGEVDYLELAEKKQKTIDRINAQDVSSIEIIQGLVRIGVIQDQAGFIEEIKKYRMVDK